MYRLFLKVLTRNICLFFEIVLQGSLPTKQFQCILSTICTWTFHWLLWSLCRMSHKNVLIFPQKEQFYMDKTKHYKNIFMGQSNGFFWDTWQRSSICRFDDMHLCRLLWCCQWRFVMFLPLLLILPAWQGKNFYFRNISTCCCKCPE